MRKLIALSALVFVLGLGATSTAQAKHNKINTSSYIVRGLLCIHSYEGSWSDPDAPYWGGLQMDLSFQATYGWFRVAKHTPHVHKIYFKDKWGTADRWPIWAQLVAGIHGYLSRGWYPWPNTARYCGLI